MVDLQRWPYYPPFSDQGNDFPSHSVLRKDVKATISIPYHPCMVYLPTVHSVVFDGKIW